MAQSDPFCPTLPPETALTRCAAIRAKLRAASLLADPSFRPEDANSPNIPTATSWRISPCPLLLSRDQVDRFIALGPHLLSFYRALNRLYFDSVKAIQPAWIAHYLDQGKPESVVAYGRMNRFREALPAVIRPDVIPTQDGMVITELDSVPGGIGLTAALGQAYAAGMGDLSSPNHSADFRSDGFEIVGGQDGMMQGFASMLQYLQGDRAGCIAFVVSEEARDYRPEMTWLAAQLRERGVSAWCVEPQEIRFSEEGLRLQLGSAEMAVGLIYRFFELFDLPNIPKSELVQYAVKKERVAVTPPYKPALEEKSAFALLHHPTLRSFWKKALGEIGFLQLTSMMPRTWILDPAPIPPMATIPGLHLGERAVANWADLAAATQKQRHFVIKASGFSELAWGSRGVSVGHDLPQDEWASVLRHAIDSFHTTPYVLQEFHKGKLFEIDYLDERTGAITRMGGRVRLSPYYFVTGEKVELAGILATVCPADKKIIHGMKDAVMVPCAIASQKE